MKSSKKQADDTDNALDNFKNIKKSIKGIFEVFQINFPEHDLYFKIGLDNIVALYQNFLELMTNEVGAQEFMKMLKDSKIKVDIPLGNNANQLNKF